jgi:hypothetical protein
VTIQVLKKIVFHSQKHFADRVSLSEGKKKAQKRCTVCSDKEKYLIDMAGRKDTSYQCTDFSVGLCVTHCSKLFHTVMHYEK